MSKSVHFSRLERYEFTRLRMYRYMGTEILLLLTISLFLERFHLFRRGFDFDYRALSSLLYHARFDSFSLSDFFRVPVFNRYLNVKRFCPFRTLIMIVGLEFDFFGEIRTFNSSIESASLTFETANVSNPMVRISPEQRKFAIRKSARWLRSYVFRSLSFFFSV